MEHLRWDDWFARRVRRVAALLTSRWEPLQQVMDNGAEEVLLPTVNNRDLLEAHGDIVVLVNSLFYSNLLQSSVKALGLA